MGNLVLPDSDVMVDFLRGHDKAVAFIQGRADRIILSSVVVAELYAGAREGTEMVILDELLEAFRVVPVTAAIARAGGIYKRVYGKSHGVGLADGILAATARSEKAELATLNVRHYPMLKGLKPPYRKG